MKKEPKTQRLSVRVDPKLLKKIHKAAKNLGLPFSDFVTMVMELECDFVMEDSRLRHRAHYYDYDFLTDQFLIMKNHMSKSTLTGSEQARAYILEGQNALMYYQEHPEKDEDEDLVIGSDTEDDDEG